MGRLEVRIVQARNLPDVHWISKPDPYAIVYVSGVQHTTDVKDNCLAPRWDQSFKYLVKDANSNVVYVQIWNSNVISDDFLGECTVSISNLRKGETRDEWHLLKQCPSNAEIRLKLTALDFGDSVAPTYQPPPPASVAQRAQYPQQQQPRPVPYAPVYPRQPYQQPAPPARPMPPPLQYQRFGPVPRGYAPPPAQPYFGGRLGFAPLVRPLGGGVPNPWQQNPQQGLQPFGLPPTPLHASRTERFRAECASLEAEEDRQRAKIVSESLNAEGRLAAQEAEDYARTFRVAEKHAQEAAAARKRWASICEVLGAEELCERSNIAAEAVVAEVTLMGLMAESYANAKKAHAELQQPAMAAMVPEWFLGLLQPFYRERYIEGRQSGVLEVPDTRDTIAPHVDSIFDVTVGDLADCQDIVGDWYDATVIAMEGHQVRVHLNCRENHNDEWISLPSSRLKRLGEMTGVTFMPHQYYINGTVRPFEVTETPVPWIEIAKSLFGPYLPPESFDTAIIKTKVGPNCRNTADPFESRRVQPALFEEFMKNKAEQVTIAMQMGDPTDPLPEPSPEAWELPPRFPSEFGGAPQQVAALTHWYINAVVDTQGHGIMQLRYGPNVPLHTRYMCI